jgi:YjbE family integral membrane protein
MFDPSSWVSLFLSGWAEVGEPAFWGKLTAILWINIILSGDNAVVIAMACLGLPARQRFWGMIFGAGVAVVLRVVFTVVVAGLMQLPFVKLIGGLALFYIAAKLLVPEDEDEAGIESVDHLWRAIRIIAVADVVMSLDNVIAIASAAGNNFALIVIGLAISIPVIVGCAAVIMALLDRYPILIWAGAALLGWIVGQVIATDPAVAPVLAYVVDAPSTLDVSLKSTAFGWNSQYSIHANLVEVAMAALGTVLVLIVGGMWRRAKLAKHASAPVFDESAVRKETLPAE